MKILAVAQFQCIDVVFLEYVERLLRIVSFLLKDNFHIAVWDLFVSILQTNVEVHI